jgi:hypothetical protein
MRRLRPSDEASHASRSTARPSPFAFRREELGDYAVSMSKGDRSGNLRATRAQINNASTSAQTRAFKARQIEKQKRDAEARKLRASQAAATTKAEKAAKDAAATSDASAAAADGEAEPSPTDA